MLTLKLLAFIFLSTLTALSSCNGQNTSYVTDASLSDQQTAIAKGDTVKEPGKNIMVIFQDKKNNFWFGSWEDGVYRYDGKAMLHFTTKDGLCHNRIDEIKEDNSGNIYFNTSGGISKFDGKNFTTLRMTSNSSNEWKLESDDLWFRQGWDSGFVLRYDGKVLHRLTLPNTKPGDEYLVTHANQPASAYSVYSIYKDTKGNVWFGTNPLGVFRYNGKSIDWISEDDVTELHDGPANGVRSIIEDKDGYFWFNTKYRYNVYGSTYGKSNRDHRRFYNREKGIGSLDGKQDGNLYEYLSITKDNNNNLWIATYRNGVWRYDGENIIHYPVKDGAKDITVFSIYKDNNGDLWLGTHETGAYKFNGKTFERFRP